MKSLLFVLCCVLPLNWLAAQQVPPSSEESYIAKGDSARDIFDQQEALKNYQLAYQIDSTNCEALWKISRAHVDIGEESDKKLQKENYYTAEKFARKAVAQCPDNADAHLTLAIAVGRVALLEGGKKKVELSKEVKAEAEKALELNPDKDIEHHVLARWHREVANLSGFLKVFAKILYGGLPPASVDKAVEHFEKAVVLNPGFVNHHLELGITFQEMKEWQKAKEQYELVQQLPEKESDDKRHKEDATERLIEVNKKI